MWTLISLVSYSEPAEALKAVGLEEQTVSLENVEVAQRQIDAYNRRDLDGLREQAVSQENVEVVRSINAAWERG